MLWNLKLLIFICGQSNTTEGGVKKKPQKQYDKLLTGSLLPVRVQICHKYGIIYLTKEPLQHICHILNEIVPNSKFDVASILPKLLHQKFDSGLGSIFPVDPFMAQTYKYETIIKASSDIHLHWFEDLKVSYFQKLSVQWKVRGVHSFYIKYLKSEQENQRKGNTVRLYFFCDKNFLWC